jgi:hypothetical protein
MLPDIVAPKSLKRSGVGHPLASMGRCGDRVDIKTAHGAQGLAQLTLKTHRPAPKDSISGKSSRILAFAACTGRGKIGEEEKERNLARRVESSRLAK